MRVKALGSLFQVTPSVRDHQMRVSSARARGPRTFTPDRISKAIRATVAFPVPTSRAVLRMPVPAARETRTAASRSAESFGRPKARPLRVPFWRALAMPTAMRSWMIEAGG